jgi:hypothetical protein
MTADFTEATATFNDAGAALYDALTVHYPSVIALNAAMLADYEGNDINVTATMGRIRAALAESIATGTPGAMALGPQAALYARALIEMAGSVGYPLNDEASVQGAISWLQQYFQGKGIFAADTRSLYVTDRPIDRGTVVPPSGTWMDRLLVDRWGQPNRRGQFETIRAQVIDGVTSAQQRIQLIGNVQGRDVFEQLGSGLAGNIVPILDEKPRNIGPIRNGVLGIGAPDNGAALTSIADWTLSATNHWVCDTTSPFRTKVNSIKTSTNGAYIRQNYGAMVADVPYLPVVVTYPDASFVSNNCTVTIKHGAHSQVFTGSAAGTAAQWNIIKPTLDVDLWLNAFDSATTPYMDVTIGIATAGTIKLALAMMLPGTIINGVPYFAVVGPTPPLVGATGSFTDADTSGLEGKHTILCQLLFGIHLPVTGSVNVDSISET